MITVFRKIRSQLLGEKNMAKYLKYAIGEIALVVIGILIAFAINSWNQGRLEKIEEAKLLENVKFDFEKAIQTFNRLNVRRDESLQTFDMLLEIVESKNFENELILDTLLAKTIFTPTYNGKAGSLSVLVNSGKINLLSNDKLKTLLLEWPQEIEDITEEEVDMKELTLNSLIPLIRKHLAMNELFKHLPLQDAQFQTRTSRIKKNYMALFSDPQFENLITMLELYYAYGKIGTANLITHAESIIGIIEGELRDN